MIDVNRFLKRQMSNARLWLGFLIVTTVLALVLNVLALQYGYDSVAPNLFYVPVVIAAYWYPDRGPIVSGILAGAYLGMVYYFTDPGVRTIIAASITCYVLIGVSVLVSSLVTHMRTNELKYQGLFNHSQAGVGRVDLATLKIHEVNHHFSAILGYAESDLLAIPFDSLFVNADKKNLFVSRMKQDSSIENFEARFRSQENGNRWVLISAGMLTDDQFVATVIDITDRKNAEQTLRIKDHAISSSINAIAILDLNFKVTYVNKALLSLVGCRDDTNLIGRDSVIALKNPRQYEVIRNAVMSKGCWFGEVELQKSDKTPYYGLLWINQVRDEKGEPICIMAFFIDITDRRQMETDQREALQQIEKNIGQFAILGDNIRNPLAVIVGLASLYDADVSDRILMQAKEIDRIVTQLDKGWIESENVRSFIRKYYRVGDTANPDPRVPPGSRR